MGICKDDIDTRVGGLDTIEKQLKTIFKNFSNELFNREILYYRHLLMGVITDPEFNRIILILKEFEENYCIAQKISHNSKAENQEGFAVLDSKNVRYYINKTVTVLGRAKKSKVSQVYWQVDINLKDIHRCSKQQAVILYNFEASRFEIKNLSTKFPTQVNGYRFTHKDDPYPLENGSKIIIGDEKFTFLTAKVPQNQSELLV